MAGNATLRWGTTRLKASNGLLYAFRGGRAYFLPPRSIDDVDHMPLHMPYMKLFLHMEEVYGRGAEGKGAYDSGDGGGYLPNVDFLLSTEDTFPTYPRIGVNDSAARRLRMLAPQFRYNKNNRSQDLLVPIFHFGHKRYDSFLLANVEAATRLHPWAERLPIAFGRFTSYARATLGGPGRLGADGATICAKGSCKVRDHFCEWAEKFAPPRAPPPSQQRPSDASHRSSRQSDLEFPTDKAAHAMEVDRAGTKRGWWIDVSLHGKVPFMDHTLYRYLVHLDGVALSSRLEQLLTLGSLVVKEESGLIAFYHHLLRPHEHYLPFWQQVSGPEDIVPMLDWAVKHDAEARRIAHAGQAFAVRYLNAQARHCYVLWLLQGYASALRYKPPQPRFAPDLVPLGEYVRKHVLQHDRLGRIFNESDFRH
ncbi:hypothetical protein HYH03_005410 [Edaphochlamys debaryana]|uniref:Glycosyl transferase CAP10 domain-containing protein n=1 Tax=Edaphochlamys debaryana TaxID=47281 RepID=A0A836C2E1_9CHLO|nr:hypothetical protein HYH03_005410 [Edaphochlamys debaryana]|eukprot:KAG2496588.1 hypothetical protein HYH03_005410 [Edaphochlamys debaryana]